MSFVLAAAVCISANCTAQPAVYSCQKVCVPPVIDGKLDDAAWKNAQEITFLNTTDGSAATRKTTAKMCWDDKNIYIAYDMEDQCVWSTLTKRDDALYTEDVAEVFLNPSCDLTNYYEMEFSPKNVQFDSLIHYNNVKHSFSGDVSWTCVGLQSAVNVCDGKWTVEAAIPFESLNRQTPKPGERWRGNLYRIDYKPEPAEFQAWSPTLKKPAAFHVPDKFGTIFFVE